MEQVGRSQQDKKTNSVSWLDKVRPSICASMVKKVSSTETERMRSNLMGSREESAKQLGRLEWELEE